MAASVYKDAYFPLYIGVIQAKRKSPMDFCGNRRDFFCIGCVQRSWTTLAGASPVAVIASEPCS